MRAGGDDYHRGISQSMHNKGKFSRPLSVDVRVMDKNKSNIHPRRRANTFTAGFFTRRGNYRAEIAP